MLVAVFGALYAGHVHDLGRLHGVGFAAAVRLAFAVRLPFPVRLTVAVALSFAFRFAVVLTAAAGLAVIGFGGSWRVGLRILSGAIAAAGLLRMILRDRDAGMLAVRNRWLDAGLAIGAAVALTILSITIPDQPV